MGQLENKKNIESFTGLEKSRMFGGLEGMQESWKVWKNIESFGDSKNAGS